MVKRKVVWEDRWHFPTAGRPQATHGYETWWGQLVGEEKLWVSTQLSHKRTGHPKGLFLCLPYWWGGAFTHFLKMLHFYTGSPLRSVKLQNYFRQWEFLIFIYFRVQQVFVAACGLSHCGGFSCCRVWAPGAWTAVVVHRLCPTACGIFLKQGSNQCSLHWQADSYPLGHQRGPQTMKVFNQEWGIKNRIE